MIADVRNNPAYFEKDPKKKGRNWANNLVTMFRQDWTPIVDPERARKGMEYLMSKQDLDYVKKSFKANSSFVKTLNENKKWLPIAVWERIRNIIIAEYKKSYYKPQVNATDPSSTAEKKRDRTILSNRDLLIKPLNDLNRRKGDPPFQIPKEQYAGNVELFDELGLDHNNPMDTNFFFSTFHRLNHEISAQELLWALMDYNEFESDIDYIVNDILAKKAVGFRSYTSPESGEIKWKYINASNIRAIRGERKDFKDAACIGYPKKVNVRQFLEFAGSDFNFENDRRVLMSALQASGYGSDWVDLTYSGGYNDKGECVTSWNQVLKYSVDIGYMEWKSVEGVAGKRHKKTGMFYDIAYDQDVPANSSYNKETTVFQKTYKTWFLSTGTMTQHLFHYGPLYHQLTEGAYDEYSSYSIHAMVMEGLTAVEAGEQFVDIANKAFYKMMWGIDQSIPRKRIINYDSVVKLASKLKGGGTAPTGMQPNSPLAANAAAAQNVGIAGQINSIVENYADSLVEMYTIPEIDGQKFGGNQRLNYWEEGGIDPIAVAMQTVLDWAEAQVSNRLGFNALRDAYTPDPKDGLKLNLEALKQSRNATYYIPEMMGFVIKNASISSMLRAQDGIEFPGTPIYKFIQKLIGDDAIEDFKALNKIPAHRYGIFVSVANTQEQREEFKQEARIAYEKGQITFDQYFVVKEYEDYKKASKILSFYKYKNDKEKEKEAALLHERAMQLEQAKTQGQIAIDSNKGYWAIEEKNVWGEWYMRAHQIPADAAIQKKAMEQENNSQKQNEAADAEIKKKKAESLIENSSAAPPVTASAETQ